MKKEVRREKRDKIKAAEWERDLAKGQDVGPVEEFKRRQDVGKNADDDDDGPESFDVEYQSLKKEIKAEKQARKGARSQRDNTGMFDDLD